MPATSQWAVSTLIREVLADPDLAGRASSAACSGPGRTGPVGVRGRRRDRRAAPRRARRSAPTGATASASRRWPPPPGRSKPAIPELRTGSFLPSLLHPRRRVDKALMRGDLLRAGSRARPARKAWRPGTRPWAMSPGSAAPRSRGSATGIDEGVHEFLARSLDRTWFPYVFVDATYLDVRAGRRVVCRALVVATGVSAQGRREILGMALGDAETTDFWTSFLRSLRERGLKVPSPHDPEGVVLDYR